MNRSLGYIRDGEPTDAQIELQDIIDNAIFNFLNQMNQVYHEASRQPFCTIEWDIEKISDVRNRVESLLNLPDVY